MADKQLSTLGDDIVTALKEASARGVKIADVDVEQPLDASRMYIVRDEMPLDNVFLLQYVGETSEGRIYKEYSPVEQEVTEGGFMGVIVSPDGLTAATKLLSPREAASNFGKMTIHSFSAARTILLTEAQHCFVHPGTDATARTITIPAGFPEGTVLTFVNENGAGVVTIAPTDTTRLAGAGTTGNRTLAANGFATAIKLPSGSWLISGPGLT